MKKTAMRIKHGLLLGALTLAGASLSACGNLPEEPGKTDVEVAQGALLGTPGAFYNVPPSFGFCGSSSLAECHGGYSFNSRGAKPSFLRRGPGMYRVLFDNQPSNGNTQVVAASGNGHCTVAAQFPSGSGVGIDVFCRAPGGVLTDSQFMLSYYRDTNVGGSLGGYANVSAVAPFTISNAWNSTGGPVVAQSLGLGSYRVTFAGQIPGGDNAQVTALTSGGAYCTLGANGWSGGVVDVRCFDTFGVPAAVPFSLSYGHNVRGEPRNTLATGTQGALLFVASQGGLDQQRSRNSCQAGMNAVVLQQPGNQYVETYHAVTTTQGEVPLMSLVTSISGSGAYCNLDHFPIQGVRSDSRGEVSCFAPNGASTTSFHSTMFIIQDHSGC